MHEDMTSVAAEGENPVRLPPRNQVITRNEHDGHVTGIEGAHENRFGDGSQVARYRERGGLAAEVALRELHHPAAVGGLGGGEEIGTGTADIDLGREAMAGER